MTSMDAGRRHTPPVHTPRLRLKPKAPQSGYVDGAWWPHSEDLTAELPDLLSVLSVRLGPIGRVIYSVNEWANATCKIGDRRANGTTRRISSPACQHRRSPRAQSKQNRPTGGFPAGRPRPGTRHHDDRGRPGQCLDGRQPPYISAEETGNPVYRPIQAAITQNGWESTKSRSILASRASPCSGDPYGLNQRDPPSNISPSGYADNAVGSPKSAGIAMRRRDG